MSRPRSLELAAGVVAGRTETDRGTFASFRCQPTDTGLPRGHVLLIPGFTGSKEDFAPLLPLLAAAGWSAATYDQRGQFETPGRPTDDFSLDAMADDAVEVSRALFGTDETVHLVGHSFGGLVAATAAINHPHVWASLTLMCSGPGGFVGDTRSELLGAAQQIRREGLESAYLLSQERDLARGREAPPPDIEDFLRRRFLANSPESLAAIAQLLAETPDLTDSLVALELPVAVVRGETDDAWPHDVQAKLADALGTRVVVVAGAGHSPAVEQPEETRDALARIWLASSR